MAATEKRNSLNPSEKMLLNTSLQSILMKITLFIVHTQKNQNRFHFQIPIQILTSILNFSLNKSNQFFFLNRHNYLNIAFTC